MSDHTIESNVIAFLHETFKRIELFRSHVSLSNDLSQVPDSYTAPITLRVSTNIGDLIISRHDIPLGAALCLTMKPVVEDNSEWKIMRIGTTSNYGGEIGTTRSNMYFPNYFWARRRELLKTLGYENYSQWVIDCTGEAPDYVPFFRGTIDMSSVKANPPSFVPMMVEISLCIAAEYYLVLNEQRYGLMLKTSGIQVVS